MSHVEYGGHVGGEASARDAHVHAFGGGDAVRGMVLGHREDVVGPHARRVDDRAGGNGELFAADLVATAHRRDPAGGVLGDRECSGVVEHAGVE